MSINPNYRTMGPSRRSNRWFARITVSSLLIILCYTWFPFNFNAPAHWSLSELYHSFSQDEVADWQDLGEVAFDLAAFLGLSLGLTGWLHQSRVPLGAKRMGIPLACVILAAIAEVLQAFLPTRNPNFADIGVAAMGAVAGYVGFYLWREQSPRRLAFSLISYALVTGMLCIVLPPFDFKNWDSSFPLILGNEETGDRPWQGEMSTLKIANRALSPAEVAHLFKQPLTALPTAWLASYTFMEEPAKHSQFPDRLGKLPALKWQGTSRPEALPTAVQLSANHWLQTETPATYLAQQLKASGQFSISTTIAAANLTQTGPARIISLSKDAATRNLTIAQQGDRLSLRLRTPATGLNGGIPEIASFPGVFTNSDPHHLLITYADTVLRVYIDRPDQVHTVRLPLMPHKVLTYGLMFIPLGVLLALIIHRWKPSLERRAFAGWAIGGTVIPALLLELTLASTEQRPFSLLNVELGLIFMGGSLLLVSLQRHRLWGQLGSDSRGA